MRLRHRPLHRRLLVQRRSRCPRPTPIPPPRACARAGAPARSSPMSPRSTTISAAVDIPAAIAHGPQRRRAPAACAASTSPASRSASKPCGTSPWRCSAAARPCPTSAASKRPPEPPPEPSDPSAQARARRRTARPSPASDMRCTARRGRIPGASSIASPWPPSRLLGAAVISHFDALTGAQCCPVPADRTARRAARQHRVPPDQGRLVLRLHELPGPRAPRTTARPEYEATLRDQRLARNLAARVRAACEPRGGAGPRHDVRLSAESLSAQAGGLRGQRADDEHARRHAL